VAVGTPVAAKARVSANDAGLAYLQARAASMDGDHGRAAALLAALAEARPGDTDIARRGVAEAIGAGQMDLAIELARRLPPTRLSTDARLLLAASEMRRNRADRALPWLSVNGDNGNLEFIAPLVRGWAYAARGNLNEALQAIDQVPATGLLGPLRAEERALILLKFKRTAEAQPFAERAAASAGARETQLRLAFADGFLAAGDKARAIAILEGVGSNSAAARARIMAGKRIGQAIDTPAKAFSDILTSFARDVARIQRMAPPVGLVQVARYSDPQNSSASLLLALILDGTDRSGEALNILRSIPADDAFASQVRDVQARILTDEKRYDEAYAIAAAAAAQPGAGIAEFSRLGDVLAAMKRHDAAADAYGRAAALAKARGAGDELWPLLLLRASTLEEGGRWPEARQALQEALALAPNQPLILNFLGYAKLERGEDVDSAEAMIRKASELAPEDASITDSLGWAQYKRGKLGEAIDTLQRAAEKDPDQAEIQEHLGDALFKSGRRLEARFAWNAALVTADDEVAVRVKAKLASGLTPANAAP
jgi:tetratricopeptide (TPR) repeat protein